MREKYQGLLRAVDAEHRTAVETLQAGLDAFESVQDRQAEEVASLKIALERARAAKEREVSRLRQALAEATQVGREYNCRLLDLLLAWHWSL